jgi:hypothetical protein
LHRATLSFSRTARTVRLRKEVCGLWRCECFAVTNAFFVPPIGVELPIDFEHDSLPFPKMDSVDNVRVSLFIVEDVIIYSVYGAYSSMVRASDS